MLKTILKAYKKFFDETIGNGTSIISLIAIIIIMVASCIPHQHFKANALESKIITQK